MANPRFNKQVAQPRQALMAGGRAKKMGGCMMRSTYSKGTVKPKDKKLAAMYGDKNKVTRGDIITAAKKNKGKA